MCVLFWNQIHVDFMIRWLYLFAYLWIQKIIWIFCATHGLSILNKYIHKSRLTLFAKSPAIYTTDSTKFIENPIRGKNGFTYFVENWFFFPKTYFVTKKKIQWSVCETSGRKGLNDFHGRNWAPADYPRKSKSDCCIFV